jgi:hypothetical protein
MGSQGLRAVPAYGFSSQTKWWSAGVDSLLRAGIDRLHLPGLRYSRSHSETSALGRKVGKSRLESPWGDRDQVPPSERTAGRAFIYCEPPHPYHCSKIKPCMSKYKLLILLNCEWLIKSVIVYLMVPYYTDNRKGLLRLRGAVQADPSGSWTPFESPAVQHLATPSNCSEILPSVGYRL